MKEAIVYRRVTCMVIYPKPGDIERKISVCRWVGPQMLEVTRARISNGVVEEGVDADERASFPLESCCCINGTLQRRLLSGIAPREVRIGFVSERERGLSVDIAAFINSIVSEQI